MSLRFFLWPWPYNPDLCSTYLGRYRTAFGASAEFAQADTLFAVLKLFPDRWAWSTPSSAGPSSVMFLAHANNFSHSVTTPHGFTAQMSHHMSFPQATDQSTDPLHLIPVHLRPGTSGPIIETVGTQRLKSNMMELAKVMARKTPSSLRSLPDILKSGWGKEDKGDEV